MSVQPVRATRSAGLAAAGALAVALTVACGPSAEAPAAAQSDPSIDTDMVPVVRQDVVETQKAQASVGFGTSITLPVDLEGLVTWAPLPLTTLKSGDVLVEVGGRPVFFVVGESPLYRPLRLVGRWEVDEAGTRLGQQKGADVAQLQQYLLDLGFDDKGRMTLDEVFGLSTQRAVKDWQKSVGHPATGIVDSSQIVFMTSEVLLQTEYRVGQSFTPIEVTGTGTVLTVTGSTTLRDFFPVGATIDVSSQPPTTGVVTRSSRISDQEGVRQLIEISVDGVNPDELGQSIEVVGSLTQATDVLSIPVRALLAKSDGTWRVEVDSGGAISRIDVELVSVFGTTAIIEGLEEGDEVVIPL